MYCSNCGKEIAENSKFCPFCGSEIKIDEVKRLYDKAAWLEDNGNYDKALEIYKELANNNDAKAITIVGTYAQYGIGNTPKDIRKAVSCYKQAVKMNNADAMYFLACLYGEGNGVFRNNIKSNKLFKAAADLGNVDAMYELGMQYIKGNITGYEDYNSALPLLTKASELGQSDAKEMLGEMFLNGVNVKRDMNRAIELLEDSAKDGNEYAINVLEELKMKGYYNDNKCLKLKDNSLTQNVDRTKIEEYIKIAQADLDNNLLNDACTNLRRIVENICNQALVNYDNASNLDLNEKIRVIKYSKVLDENEINLLTNLRLLGNKGTHENDEYINKNDIVIGINSINNSYIEILNKIYHFYYNQPKIINI